ncbi:MAG: serine/threonine protein kinase [Bacteroidota bacterium]
MEPRILKAVNAEYLFFPEDEETTLSNTKLTTVHVGARAGDAKRVIIKQLNPELRKIQHARVHFLVQASIQIQHPGVIKTLDLAKDKHSYYIIQEFVHGTDIKTLIKTNQAQSSLLISKLMIPVLDAFEVVHNHNIVHRNIKPSNILIAYKPKSEMIDWQNPDVRLIDFDKAKTNDNVPVYRGDDKRHPFSLLYSAPEIVLNYDDLTDHRADLYSLGLIMMEMFTGKPVIYDDNPAKILAKQLSEIPQRPKKMYPRFYDILMKATAKAKIEGSPSKISESVISEKLREGISLRYKNAAAMKSDLIDFIKDPGHEPPRKGIKGLFTH